MHTWQAGAGGCSQQQQQQHRCVVVARFQQRRGDGGSVDGGSGSVHGSGLVGGAAGADAPAYLRVGAADPPFSSAAAEASAELPLPRDVESAVDDPLLNNPLERMRRIDHSWCGVVMDFEGGVVAPQLGLHRRAWQLVALERGLPAPLGSALERVGAARDEAFVARVLCWTGQPEAAAALAERKREVFEELLAAEGMAAAQAAAAGAPGAQGAQGAARAEVPGLRDFLAAMASFDVRLLC